MTAETLRTWVRQAEHDSGRRPGLTTDERQKMRDLEKKVKELRRANDILKAAAHLMRTPRLCGLGGAVGSVVAGQPRGELLSQSA